MPFNIHRRAIHLDMSGLFIEMAVGRRPSPKIGERGYRISLLCGIGQAGLDRIQGRFKLRGVFHLGIIPAWSEVI